MLDTGHIKRREVRAALTGLARAVDLTEENVDSLIEAAIEDA